MNINRITSFKKSRFTEYIIRANALDKHGFKEWIFYPGMLFNASGKWWGDFGKRDNLHEGLDLCLYRNTEDEVLRLDAATKIPAMYDGVIVKIINDFLGKSVILEHKFPDNNKLCSIYAHILLRDEIYAGSRVREGDIIATLACTERSKSGISPHLHISTGWLTEHASCEQLDWEGISISKALCLIDPLQFLDLDYHLLLTIP